MFRGKGYSTRAVALLVVTDILMLIAFVTVVMRLIGRYFILHSPAADDLFAFLALITSTATIVCINIGVKYGTGEHESNVDVNKNTLGKIQLATQILYTTASGLIKLTILLLYLRLFPGLRIWILSTMGFIIAMSITFIFAATFQCNQVGRFWATNNEGESNCVNTLILWCDIVVTYLVTNIWITVLPLPTLLGLHLPRRKKAMVIAFLCSAGFVTVVAAAVRLAYVIILYKGHDPSYNSVPIHICSAVEMTVALIACSIPPLRSAFSTFIDKWHSWRSKKSSYSGSSTATV